MKNCVVKSDVTNRCLTHLLVAAQLLAGRVRQRLRTVLVGGQQRQQPALRRHQLHPAPVAGQLAQVHRKAAGRRSGQHQQAGQQGGSASRVEQVRTELGDRLNGGQVEQHITWQKVIYVD